MLNRTQFEGAAHRSRLLVNSISGIAIYMLDAEGNVCTWNLGAERVKGYTAEEILGCHFSAFYTPEDNSAGEPARGLQMALEHGCYEHEGWRIRKDRSRFWASVIVEPIYASGQHIGFAKVTRDVTRERAAEEQLAHANRVLDLALSNMSQGLALYDSNETLILANDRYSSLTGIPPGVVQPGMKLRTIMEVRDGAQAEAQYWWSRARRAAGRTEEVMTIKGEPEHVVSVSEQLLPDGGWIATFEDITERVAAEATLARMAHYDALTEVPNRVLFGEFLKQAIGQARRGNKCALLSIDINRFTAINDTFGHKVGDELLKEIAYRLRTCVRDGDMLARIGGDEFALIQTGIGGAKDAESLAIRLIESLRLPFLLESQEVLIDSTVGIALAPEDGAEIDELLKSASHALYRAKKANGTGYNFFEHNIDVRLAGRRTLELDLRQALRRNEFEPFYQGLIDVETKKIVGYEALLRWRHPLRGLISPADFIPVAEESGLIVPISEWVLLKALQQAALLPAGLKIAVNLSAAQLRNSSFFNTVQNALASTAVGPDRLELEITESTLMDGGETVMATLGQLQAFGVRIALDDFGTGFSSLSYLRNFRFDRLKIDRSFIRDLADSEPSRVLTRAITGLGASFGIAVTGEGVESLDQFEYLKAMGCAEVQGFYFSKPKPASDLADEIRNYPHAQP